MDFFSQTYNTLRGPVGAQQNPLDTIARLSDRLSPSTLLADRRAAVLSLKGLARDCKRDVGERALPGLLQVLQDDAPVDADIGKAVLETLNILCDAEDGNAELARKHTDVVLSNEKPTHSLFALLGDDQFYTRLASLQLLGTLLQQRRQIVQKYFLTAATGPAGVIAIIDDKREIIRNEVIAMIQNLVSQNADIQKLLAFEGAFEKLFNIIMQEGGVEGGIVAQDTLACIDSLLRFNSSNQSYFRETPYPGVLLQLLVFPPQLQFGQSAPQEFALQFWDKQKTKNVSLVIGLVGMMVGVKGGNSSGPSIFTRCLVEIALASNAPTSLKTQALRLLPTSLNFPLSEIVLTPYMPVPDTNGEEWDRLEPASALDVLVELVLHGEYNGTDGAKRTKDGLELRASATIVFENFVRNDDIRLAILQAMLPVEGSQTPPPVTPLLHSLIVTHTSPLDLAAVSSSHFSAILFSHLVRSSSRAKALARAITPSPASAVSSAGNDGGSFFVPADGAPPPAPAEADDDDDDETQTLVQIICENLSLAFLARARADTSDREAREWNRLVVAYLSLLLQWLWDDPGSVRAFLDAGGLGVLVEPINQTSESDTIVPGLCTFLLGTCYEFNRDPGEITRAKIHSIINRFGVDSLIGRMTRAREDDVFKAVGPDAIVHPYPGSAYAPHLASKDKRDGSQAGGSGNGATSAGEENEIWFDWAFVDFWKSNFYTVQRGLSIDPNNLSTSSSGDNAESTMLIASLREMIQNQSHEIQALKERLAALNTSFDAERKELQGQVSAANAQLKTSEEKKQAVEKEQEDLLVLLDELSDKRKRDKAKMRQAGLEVSEDEEDEDEDEDDEDEDEEEEEE